jgi:hypothetical protein
MPPDGALALTRPSAHAAHGRAVDVMLLADKTRAGAQKLPHSNPQTQDSILRGNESLMIMV